MEKYESAGNFDRLFSEESEMLQNEGFETKKAGIRLLGRDVAKIASPYTRQLILSILEEATREDSSPRLSVDMALGVSTADVDLDDIGTKISKLRQGFEDVIGNT
jgi:predicted nucleotidyltransferase